MQTMQELRCQTATSLDSGKRVFSDKKKKMPRYFFSELERGRKRNTHKPNRTKSSGYLETLKICRNVLSIVYQPHHTFSPSHSFRHLHLTGTGSRENDVCSPESCFRGQRAVWILSTQSGQSKLCSDNKPFPKSRSQHLKC